jgi:glycosyltransferase 2 family protein
MTTRIPRRWRKALVVVFGLTVGAGALAYSAKGVDGAGLAQAFGGVTWWWVGAAALANMINIAAQGWAWRIGLEAGGAGPIAARHAIAATWVGKAGNQLLPGKIGEIARIAVIRPHLAPERREISRIAGTLVAQRAFYILATLIIVAITASVMPLPIRVPGGRWAPLLALAGVAAAIAIVARFKPSRPRVQRTSRLGAILATFAGGAALLRPSRAAAGALGFHMVGVAAQLTMLECLLRGFDVIAPPTAPLLIIALIGLVGAVPGAPGGAGLNQAALVAPLGAAYGVSASSALAFALGMQATLAVVAAAGGLVGMIHHRQTGRLRAAFP